MKVPGNIQLAGIFNVHMKGNIGRSYWQRCGMIDPQYGIMFVEAMLFAIDQINANCSLLHGLSLGARIHDTCGDRTYQRNAIINIVNYKSQGVIGPQHSEAAKTAATVFDIFGKSLISYSATSPDLEDRTKYRYFYRTVPSDRKVVKLLVNIALRLKWTYVAIVSSIESYGKQRLSSLFREYANSQGICTPIDLQVAESAEPRNFIYIFDRIIKENKIKVVYLFLNDAHLKDLFQSTDHLREKYQKLNFVVGDSLGSRVHLTKGKPLANGSLTIQVAQEEVPEFRDYFLKLRPSTNKRNIWFKEFWESTFNCSIKNDSSKARVCTGKETLSEEKGYYKSTPVLTVINAVFAYAHAFRKVIVESCILKNKTADYCFTEGNMLQGITNFKDVLHNVRNVRFTEPYRDRLFQFNEEGEITEDYAILNWFIDDKNNQKFIQVGKWNTSRSKMAEIIAAVNAYNSKPPPLEKWRLDIDTDEIRWKSGGSSAPISICSRPCEFRQVRKYESLTSKCCWTCHSCLKNDIIKNDTCYPCSLDNVPDENRVYCKKLPVMYAGLNPTIVAVVSSSTSIGVVCTILVIALFLKNIHQRIVKASGRELCLNMLIGITATYLAPIAFILKPSTAVCGLHRLVVSVSLTVSYAPLLLKTNRLYRIFRSAQTTVERPAMISPRSQIAMSLALTAISLLIGFISITGSTAQIKSAYPNHREYTLRYCKISNETVFMNLSFSTALMIATTWFAFKTRNFPKNYNEAKYIGFTMYATCLVLAVFLPVFYLVDDKDGKSRIIIMCCICWLIATINLLGLFGPKVRLMLCSNARAVGATMTMHSTVPANTINFRRVSVKP